MKNAILALVAVVLVSLVATESKAGPFGLIGRNRGGGGNMGAAQGNGLCNMAKQSSVRPSQVIQGAFGIPAEPVAPVAPDERVTTKRTANRVAAGRPARVSFDVFDAPTSTAGRVVVR